MLLYSKKKRWISLSVSKLREVLNFINSYLLSKIDNDSAIYQVLSFYFRL